MSMVFVVTAKGFLKEKIVKILDKKPEHEFIWTDKLREAKIFSTRGKAKGFIEKNHLEGFAFNPKEQESIKDMYVVVKRRENDYGFYKNNFNPKAKHQILEWTVEKAYQLSQIDVKFLNGENVLIDLYSKEDAEKICLARNEEMFKELSLKIEIFKDHAAPK